MLDFTKKVYLNDSNNTVSDEPIQIQSTDQPIYLDHDMVGTGTVSVYTGVSKTGTRINGFTLYQDTTRNWMYYLRFDSATRANYGGQIVYVNYTSYGDVCDDLMINRLEQELERHQTEDPHATAGSQLQIVSTTPGANASGVSTSVVIKFVANKWLDTNQESKFKLYSNAGRTTEVPSVVTKTGAKEYSLTPSSPLLNSTMYYPRILQGLKAADGTDLNQGNYEWSFQTINIP